MKRIISVSILCFGVLWFGVVNISAATRIVDNISDNGAQTACTAAANDCSLRGAISNAAAGDTINFDASLTNATITLTSEILLVRNVTVAGLGADKLTISGGNATRLFSYFGGSTLNINFSGLTLESGNGSGANNSNQGGAIQINGGATTAAFDRMVFRNNTGSGVGGALMFAGGACRISNSTFTNNSSPNATIYFISGSLEITNSTFSGNSGSFSVVYSFGNSVVIRNATIVNNPGGGLYKDSGTLTLGNSIVAGNGGYDLSRNSSAAINTGGGNLIGRNAGAGPNFAAAGTPNVNSDYVGTVASPIDPLLAPLGNNGGTTPTYALQSNSPAINHGNNCVLNNSCSPAMSASLTTDQRGAGFPRQFGAANVDIGAFEYQFAPTAAAVSVSGRISTAGGNGISNVVITLTDSNGNIRTTRSSTFGYYQFDEIEAGETYIISVVSKRFSFSQPSQIISTIEDAVNVDFIAEE